MIYLTRILGKPVVDASGEEIGSINDLAIATREIFPRVTALAFLGPDKTPFLLSWRKFVAGFDGDEIRLNATRPELRFSYLQPDEVLLARDLLNKQIVDTQGMKVVRVNDLKLSESRNQLRLLGAEVGLRGILRGISPTLERVADAVVRSFARDGLAENIIAWNYMDLLDRDLSHVQLSVTHKRLHELHPADVADILEQLSPGQRARVFKHLDDTQAADAISAMEDEFQAETLDDLTNQRASDILELMEPDDAADVIGDLPYDKAETLLRLMGLREARTVRRLLGYKENTAGGIMTPEVTKVTEEMTVQQVIDYLRGEAYEHENIYYVYVVDDHDGLCGVVSLRDLIISQPQTAISDIVEREIFTAHPDEDQEAVADMMSKYDLLALPVVDETGRILGIVTVDDALDVMEQESAEDLALATGASRLFGGAGGWLAKQSQWLTIWAVLGVGAAMVLRFFGDLSEELLAVGLFIPLLTRLTGDIASHSLSVLIEAETGEEQPPLGRQVAVDLVVGSTLALATALIVFVILELFARPVEDAALVAAATFGGVLAAAAASSLIPWLALKPDRSGWRAPAVLITTSVSVVGLAAYLATAAALRGVIGR